MDAWFSTVTSPAWVPVVANAVPNVLAAAAFLMLRLERRAAQDHREEIDHARLQGDLIETYQRQLETLSGRSERIETQTAEWQTRYWDAVKEQTDDREKYLRKIEEMVRERALIEGEHLLMKNRIARMQHALESLNTVIERRVKPMTDDEKQALYEARMVEHEPAVTLPEPSLS